MSSFKRFDRTSEISSECSRGLRLPTACGTPPSSPSFVAMRESIVNIERETSGIYLVGSGGQVATARSVAAAARTQRCTLGQVLASRPVIRQGSLFDDLSLELDAAAFDCPLDRRLHIWDVVPDVLFASSLERNLPGEVGGGRSLNINHYCGVPIVVSLTLVETSETKMPSLSWWCRILYADQLTRRLLTYGEPRGGAGRRGRVGRRRGGAGERDSGRFAGTCVATSAPPSNKSGMRLAKRYTVIPGLASRPPIQTPASTIKGWPSCEQDAS